MQNFSRKYLFFFWFLPIREVFQGRLFNIENSPTKVENSEAKVENSETKATAVNMRHAKLLNQQNPKCWLGFQGSRLDINASFTMAGMIENAMKNLGGKMQGLTDYMYKRSELTAIMFGCVGMPNEINIGKPDIQKNILLNLLMHSKTHTAEKKFIMETIFDKKPLNNKQAEFLRHQLISDLTKELGLKKEDVIKKELKQYIVIKNYENNKKESPKKGLVSRLPAALFNAVSKGNSPKKMEAVEIAVEKFSKAVGGDTEVSFEKDDIKILRSKGRLGKAVRRFENENSLPPAFVTAETAMKQGITQQNTAPRLSR